MFYNIVTFRSFDYGAFGTDCVFVSGSEFVTGKGFVIGYEYMCNGLFFLRARVEHRRCQFVDGDFRRGRKG